MGTVELGVSAGDAVGDVPSEGTARDGCFLLKAFAPVSFFGRRMGTIRR